MGEYAMYDGHEIKIGTCEGMCYLRADQRHLVQWKPGNVNPLDPKDLSVIRFRFPWPDEDGIPPGGFEDPDRRLFLNVAPPEDVNHGLVQFHAAPGYLVSLPCPESPAGTDLPFKIHRNGFPGQLKIVQQAYRGGRLVLVCSCAGCGVLWNYPSLEDVQPVLDALERERYSMGREGYYKAIAERIRAGYQTIEGER